MLKFADLLEANLQELAGLDTLTMGAPMGMGHFVIPGAAQTFRCKNICLVLAVGLG